jgi:hypothetical protein
VLRHRTVGELLGLLAEADAVQHEHGGSNSSG